jgi:hypothetical protein
MSFVASPNDGGSLSGTEAPTGFFLNSNILIWCQLSDLAKF